MIIKSEENKGTQMNFLIDINSDMKKLNKKDKK